LVDKGLHTIGSEDTGLVQDDNQVRLGATAYPIVKLPRGLSVRLERFQVMAIVWERHKMLPAELR
jgi:hypothetical protein